MSDSNFLQCAADTHVLSKEQIIALLRDDKYEKELFSTADEVRRATKFICAG